MKPTSVLIVVFMLSVLFVMTGCNQSKDKSSKPESSTAETASGAQPVTPHGEQQESKTAAAEEGYMFGTVKYIRLEGGFWGIMSDDGQKYDPVNLPEEFQKDGMKVKFKAEELKDMASFHMWGKIVKILEISKRQ